MRLSLYKAIAHHTELSMRVLEVLFLAATTLHAGEYAVFATGFRQLVERHESVGETTRLFANGGVIEVETAAIAGFEPAEIAAPANSKAGESPAILAEPAAESLNPKALIDRAAARYDLPPEFLHAVVAAESSYDASALSPKGAIGLMQLMPDTAAMYGADPNDPEQNVDAGTRYLRDLLLMYKDKDNQLSMTLAAYNAGPGNVQKYNGVPPYRETRNYVSKILRKYKQAPPRNGT
jgi:soluble lytic murein transglycosylase-like protein